MLDHISLDARQLNRRDRRTAQRDGSCPANPHETAAGHAAARGETVLAKSVATRLVHHMRTAREVEVLRMVARGLWNAAIGQRLNISEATVKTHLLRLFGKLGVSDRTAAVTAAMRRGILSYEDGTADPGDAGGSGQLSG